MMKLHRDGVCNCITNCFIENILFSSKFVNPNFIQLKSKCLNSFILAYCQCSVIHTPGGSIHSTMHLPKYHLYLNLQDLFIHV